MGYWEPRSGYFQRFFTIKICRLYTEKVKTSNELRIRAHYLLSLLHSLQSPRSEYIHIPLGAIANYYQPRITRLTVIKKNIIIKITFFGKFLALTSKPLITFWSNSNQHKYSLLLFDQHNNFMYDYWFWKSVRTNLYLDKTPNQYFNILQK